MNGLETTATAAGGSVRFPAILDHVEAAVSALHGYLGDAGRCVRCFEFGLLCFEALSNAVRHGNGGNPALWVDAAVDVSEDAVVLTVTDDGPGFDWQTRRQIALDDRATHGRGLWLLHQYGDQVRFNECGNQITVVKYMQRHCRKYIQHHCRPKDSSGRRGDSGDRGDEE